MKYRLSFVTNSSSSSYICDVCGSVESGRDMSLSEAEMYECVNGHTVCEYHVDFSDEAMKEAIMKYLEDFDYDYYLKEDDFREKYGSSKDKIINNIKNDEDLQEDFMDDYMELRYNLPKELCPICNFDSLNENEGLYYLLKKNGIDIKGLKKTIKEEFTSYDEFKKFIK